MPIVIGGLIIGLIGTFLGPAVKLIADNRDDIILAKIASIVCPVVVTAMAFALGTGAHEAQDLSFEPQTGASLVLLLVLSFGVATASWSAYLLWGRPRLAERHPFVSVWHPARILRSSAVATMCFGTGLLIGTVTNAIR